MNVVHTNTASVEKLCNAAAGLPQDKSAIAALMTDAFINGMNMQTRLTTAAAQKSAAETGGRKEHE